MMYEYLIYMLKTTVSMMVFYSFFLIFLKKETNFRQNRLYLMGTFFLSLTLPLLNISIFNTPPENNTVLYSLFLEPVRVTGSKIGEGLLVTGKIHYTILLYILVSLFFFGRLIAGIIYTFQVRSTGEKSCKYGINMVITHRSVKPFTFMRTIVIGREDTSRPELYQILLHEQVHAKKLHFIDLILTELFKALCWFNPFAYLYQMSLREIHEYQADAAIIDKGHDSFSYQQLLLNQLFSTKNIQFSNFFNYSLIQKRIKMIKNNKSSKYSVHKLLMVLPLAFMIAVGFSCAKEEHGNKAEADIHKNDTTFLINKDKSEKSGAVAGEKKDSDEVVYF
ncbi:MAG TPA: M56 family metallopeptidase, partial [Bacteroidales bacterium]|nr:M56 family metallopeptidase [Bacteroidales bacterium]